MFLLFLLFLVCTSPNRTHINELLDPIGLINDYLPCEGQRTFRLINRRFNYYHNKNYSDIIDHMHKFSMYAQQIIIGDIIKNESNKAIEQIYEKYKFNEYYLKKWPKIIRECLPQNVQHSEQKWMHNFLHLCNALNMRPWNTS